MDKPHHSRASSNHPDLAVAITSTTYSHLETEKQIFTLVALYVDKGCIHSAIAAQHSLFIFYHSTNRSKFISTVEIYRAQQLTVRHFTYVSLGHLISHVGYLYRESRDRFYGYEMRQLPQLYVAQRRCLLVRHLAIPGSLPAILFHKSTTEV